MIYSTNSDVAETYLTDLETLDTQTIGETLTTPERYLSSNWRGVTASTSFTPALVKNKQFTHYGQGQSFHFSPDGTGTRYPLGSDDAYDFTWLITNGQLLVTESSTQDIWTLRLLATSSTQYTVSMTEPDETGGVVRSVRTYHIE